MYNKSNWLFKNVIINDTLNFSKQRFSSKKGVVLSVNWYNSYPLLVKVDKEIIELTLNDVSIQLY